MTGHLYKNGLPFTAGHYDPLNKDLMAVNLDQLKERVNKGKASMIIVDGGVGEGKTTLAVHIADYLQGEPIVFGEQIFMGGKEFRKGIAACYEKRKIVAIYDESGDFDKKGAISKFNREMGRLFDVFRAFKITVILVLPSFLALDNGIFNKNIPRMLVHCHGRTPEQGRFSVYSLDRMMYMREYAKKAVIKTSVFSTVEPNFRGNFKNLPPARSFDLDSFSTGGKLDIIAETKTDDNTKGLYNVSDLAYLTKRSVPWVRLSLRNKNIKAVKNVKTMKYYGKEALETLSNMKVHNG